MAIHVRREQANYLPSYGKISIAFEVRAAFECGPEGNVTLTEAVIQRPYIKDYDQVEGGPESWPTRFGVRNWEFLMASEQGRDIGGATLAFDSPELNMLEGRRDLGLLWDLRVALEYRRSGVGSALLAAAVERARRRGCSRLKVETQNINVPACKFYMRHGFELRHVHRFAYPSLPDEVQLLWYRELPREA